MQIFYFNYIMKILEIIKLLKEASEKERIFKNINTLDTAYPKENEIDKERFFRRIANVIEDKIGDLDESNTSSSIRNQILNSEIVKSFSLKPRDIEGLRTILAECELDAYSRFVSKSHPILREGWLKGIYQEINDYISPEIKRGRKPKVEMTKERQVSLDISTIFETLSSIKPGTTGPFELLLCMIFGGTKITGSTKDKGDILIGNTAYEVKADGTGALDAGYNRLETELKDVQGEELNELRSKIEQEKKRYEIELNKCTKLAQKFAKVLARQYNLNTKDVKDYFSILTEEDKKRAILYGFYNCGYHNFIICQPKKSKTDFDVKIKIITKTMINNVIDGNDTLGSIGIDIINASGTYTNTCQFGDYLIKVTQW